MATNSNNYYFQDSKGKSICMHRKQGNQKCHNETLYKKYGLQPLYHGGKTGTR